MIEKQGDFNNKNWVPAASARRFEAGTPNVLGIRAFAASLSLINEVGIKNIEHRILRNTACLHKLIENSQNLEAIYTDEASTMSGIVTFRHRYCPASTVFEHLRERNIMCAERGGGIRFSPHFYNSSEELEKAIRYADNMPLDQD